MLCTVFTLSHNASTLWKKVIAFYSYGSVNMTKAITCNAITVSAVKLGRSPTKYCKLPVAPRAKQFLLLSKAMCLAVILGNFHQPKNKTFCLARYTSKVTKSLSGSLIQTVYLLTLLKHFNLNLI
jgi:hypothetical protein